jgi:chemotaxis protein CheD
MTEQKLRERLVPVVQGEYAVSGGADTILTAILGSCVAVCLRDPVVRIGGMNHFLLPGEKGGDQSLKYGIHSMELLINALLKQGGARSRLEAKMFGGACVLHGLSTDIGAKNAAFARQFLQTEGIACVGQSLGGGRGRRVRYWPATGRATLQVLPASEVWATQAPDAPAPPPGGGVELF